jgi:MoaA/NifB/PqqE/SkfB family radical SAM enzyme
VPPATSALSFMWLEITGKCQLSCRHCYADSGPRGTHGAMTHGDWQRAIDEAAGLGVDMVQFIGGEPTLHPELPALVDHALAAGLHVEVFSNLVHVSARLWDTFGRPGVRLACSYYSDDDAEHARITGRRASHARTTANIAEARRRSIPLRVGLIDVLYGQRIDAAVSELTTLGVQDIGTDRLRQVGRGQQADVDQLCGKCARGVLAISPTGTVWPCVFSRWLPVGNVREQSLDAIVKGRAVAATRAMLAAHFAGRTLPGGQASCGPYCQPTCPPNCSPSCRPQHNCAPVACGPQGNCWPKYGCKPSG